MRDEGKFPTMRFLTCRACGLAYTVALPGFDSCPRCQAPAEPGERASRGVTRSALGSHVLLTVTGTTYKLQELEALRIAIDKELQGIPDSIAFHLNGASYLDSSMLAQMVRTLQEMSKRGKSTCVITSDPQVIESLQILDLDRVMAVMPTPDAWRASLP